MDPSPDDNPKRDVRRRRTRDELAGGSAERARLIEVLTQARLFSTSLYTLLSRIRVMIGKSLSGL